VRASLEEFADEPPDTLLVWMGFTPGVLEFDEVAGRWRFPTDDDAEG
jgi:hypothetical protein